MTQDFVSQFLQKVLSLDLVSRGGGEIKLPNMQPEIKNVVNAMFGASASASLHVVWNVFVVIISISMTKDCYLYI